MFWKNRQDDQDDENIITVNGKKYYVLFNKAVDNKRRGRLLKYIRHDLKRGTIIECGSSEETVLVTEDEEVYKKMVRILDVFDELHTNPAFELSVPGFHHDFIIKSNVPYEGRALGIIVNVESTLYETFDNIRSAERTAQLLTNADFVKLERVPNTLCKFILYLIYDEKE